jgi:lipid II:glycine glycyltransferase (peptidoglycan interpeptide bridge formation enzyme)
VNAATTSRAQIDDIDDPRRWDEIVHRLGGHPLQSSAWGQLKEAFGWHAQRLAAGDGRAAAQVLSRSRFGVGVSYVPRGPMLSGDGALDGALIAELARRGRRQRSSFVRVDPATRLGSADADRTDDILRRHGFRPTRRALSLPPATIQLDLDAPLETIFGRFSKGHRADIRRAEREGLTVRPATDDSGAELLHQMLIATRQRKTFGVRSAAYYRTLWRAFGDDARLLIAERAGEVVSASLVVAWGGHGLYLFAGSTQAGLDARAAHLLQWHAIQWAHGHGARTWDLWGIADAHARLELAAESDRLSDEERAALESEAASDPVAGLYRFKKGWGGRAVRMMPAYDRVFLAPAYWLWLWRRSEA